MVKNKLLLILDGWGETANTEYNAIARANTPNYDYLLKNYPHSLLEASGLAVGLPAGQMGNSEVGHITIGAGRIVYQDLPRITKAINDGEFAKHPLLQQLTLLKNNDKTCHIMGLISDGGVHAHIDHIIAVCKFCEDNGIKYALHAFTDGRDTAPQSAKQYLAKLQEHGITPFSISGRFYAMDRDNRWDRTERAYHAIFASKGENFSDPLQLIESSYANNINDEFIVPSIREGYQGIVDGDAIIICNFRADRVRQLLSAIVLEDFVEFAVEKIKLHKVIGMVPYASTLDQRIEILFPKEHITKPIGEIIADHHLTQLRIAETEKYAHVTFFLNGGREQPFALEERIMVPSPKVATYDLMPQMSVMELGEKLCAAIRAQQYDFICANFANADMVGHSGDLKATIKAIEAIDKVLGDLINAMKEVKGEMLITADHGNAEIMMDVKTHTPFTAHTLSKVPLIYFGERDIRLEDGELKDIAPTMLTLMDLLLPNEMTGKNLINKSK